MLFRGAFVLFFLSSAVAFAQAQSAPLDAPATLPIVFTRTLSAANSHLGDAVEAKTSQAVHLANGAVIPSGTKIQGHVLAASAFAYDKTPYARQKQSALSIHFDTIAWNGQTLPLNVTVRAMADRLESDAARIPPVPHDVDPWSTMTQIGGDQLTPVQHEVTNSYGDVVGYNKHDGVYAHLIANGHCDGSDVEVSMGIYSASACGLYGFVSVAALETGSATQPSTLTLSSTHVSPKIWKYSTALLEVVNVQPSVASR
jgi:hypothetical protein